MKSLFILLSFCISTSALAVQLATVSGAPESSRDFVQRLVRQQIVLTDSSQYEVNITTAMYSLIARRGVNSTIALVVSSKDGSVSQSTLNQALELGAMHAPVVHTDLPPLSQASCEVMARYPSTAFVVVAGHEGQELTGESTPACLSENILFVTNYNQYTDELPANANWGELVRLAVPGTNIRAIGMGGREVVSSNASFGSAMAAARLAVFADAHAELSGAALISLFLDEHSNVLPTLYERINGGRALDDSGE